MGWIGEIEAVFDSIESEFAIVLDAAGCREGWLQGEFFHRLNQRDGTFRVNWFQLAKNSHADLYGELHGKMVAEIKIVGQRGYLKKNINGTSSIGAFLPDDPNGRIDITPSLLEQVNEKEGSVLKDYCRLKRADDELRKYLMLVIHKNGLIDDAGRAAQAIKFPGDETELDYRGFFVRIWPV